MKKICYMLYTCEDTENSMLSSYGINNYSCKCIEAKSLTKEKSKKQKGIICNISGPRAHLNTANVTD